MTLRIIAFLVLLSSILFMPYWVSIVLALAAIVYFSFYWESAILFLLSDLLFGVKENKFWGVLFVSAVIFLIIMIVAELLKKKIRISN